MSNTFSTYSLVIFLSLTILWPVFIPLLQENVNVELTQDLEEESKSKNKQQQLDEEQKICKDFVPITITSIVEQMPATYFYQDLNYGHVQEIFSPPPEHIR